MRQEAIEKPNQGKYTQRDAKMRHRAFSWLGLKFRILIPSELCQSGIGGSASMPTMPENTISREEGMLNFGTC